MTATEMIPAVGATVLVRCEDLHVQCTVKDVKMAYGRPRLLVTPVSGVGAQWVELGRLIAGSAGSQAAAITLADNATLNDKGWQYGR